MDFVLDFKVYTSYHSVSVSCLCYNLKLIGTMIYIITDSRISRQIRVVGVVLSKHDFHIMIFNVEFTFNIEVFKISLKCTLYSILCSLTTILQ